MGEVWIPEAEDLRPVGSHNPMSGVGGPRATLHCTVSPSGKAADGRIWFNEMHRVLTSKRAEPHLLYDPVTDRLGQYFPLNRAARALADGSLGYSHNQVGSINIQIEVVAMPRDWTADWKPGKNFRAMMRAVASWGIKPEFIYRVAKSGTDRANVVRPKSLLTSTAGGGRWWGHCHYPDGETHWDPGPIDAGRFFAAAALPAPVQPTAPVTTPTTAVGGAVFMVKRKDRDPVYKTDGFRRVHVTKVERDALLKAKVPLFDGFTSDAELAAFGPEVTA